MLIYSPYYTFKVVIHKGSALQKTNGLSLWQQYWQILAFSMGHGLSPISWYQYRLYETHKKKAFWNNIYDQEIGAFHHYRNYEHPYYQKHVGILSDKYKFEKLLEQHGIPTAKTLTIIPKQTSDFHSQLYELVKEHGELFCKRRTGNQSKGAFKAYVKGGSLRLQPNKDTPLPKTVIHDFLQKNIHQCDYLIQPNYNNHKRLQTISQGYLHPPSTVRIISYYHDEQVDPEYAVMNWPVVDDKHDVKFHYPIAINVDSGQISNEYPVWPRNNLDETQLNNLNELLQFLSDNPLPYWKDCIQLIQVIHPLLKGVDRIAWDLILTERRAILLEGNSGWGGFAVCQWFGYNLNQHIK